MNNQLANITRSISVSVASCFFPLSTLAQTTSSSVKLKQLESIKILERSANKKIAKLER